MKVTPLSASNGYIYPDGKSLSSRLQWFD